MGLKSLGNSNSDFDDYTAKTGTDASGPSVQVVNDGITATGGSTNTYFIGELKMAVPKKKTSKSKRNMRRAHLRLSVPGYVECSNCGEHMRPHHVCEACGHYKDREVITFKEEVVEEAAQEA